MKKKSYYEPVFKTDITAFIEPDSRRASSIAATIIGDEHNCKFRGLAKTIDYQGDGGQKIVIWLSKPEGALLAHELVHVVEFSFERGGINFSLNNTEVIAYYVEHLFRIFEPLIKKP